MKSSVTVLAIFVQFTILFNVSWGHGMMLDPPGRSSRWRFNSSALINFNDNENFCGGFTVQWNENGGKCGFCGDNYRNPTPRDNELGGIYGGSGVIVKTYQHLYTAEVGIQITANHLGYIFYELCNLDEFKYESEHCFTKNRLKFPDGSNKLYIGDRVGEIYSRIVLPKNLSCKHCVLRWTYHTGNVWNPCGNGTGLLGCGPQETFKSCADIRIKTPRARLFFSQTPVLPN